MSSLGKRIAAGLSVLASIVIPANTGLFLRNVSLIPTLIALVGVPATATAAEPVVGDERTSAEFFEKKIRPLFVKYCHECHSTEQADDSGHLAVDSRDRLLKGGDRGTILIPGKPQDSLLIRAVRYGDPKLQMPPAGKIPDADIDLLTKWVADGAFVPDYGSTLGKTKAGIDWERARQFWSVRPLERVGIPRFSAEASNALINPVDSFVTARLQDNGLAMAKPADKKTLIRRLTFDLIGLPPAPEEVADFMADERPDAYERLVDRLLASPHFGERWGRYWLDMTRYVDEAPDWQKNADGAWMYRDWVVNALNADRPYDEFVTLQLAADMKDDGPSDPADLAALGLIGLSPTYWKELRLAPSVIEVIVADEWDERLDTVTRTFLGLTVACARCHDHKFDPITTRDYYALAGVFASIDLVDRPLLSNDLSDQVRAARKKLDSLNDQLKKIKDKDSEEAKATQREIDEILKATPQIHAPMAPLVDEASVFVVPDGPDATKLDVRRRQPRDLNIFRRGNPSNLGEVAPRGFLELFASVSSESKPDTSRAASIRRFEQGSGRLELAQAIMGDAMALTARVITNRIWSHHFGQGLVRTPGDFGQQGERPTHPELLDWLAREFRSGGNPKTEATAIPAEAASQQWSMKRLHRQLVMSATYRQSGVVASVPANDPDNNLLWRANRRRLELEPWRDAMLAVSGRLDDRVGGKAQGLDQAGNHRRTLYGKIGRDEQDDLLRLFDFPPPTNHSPARDVTTTPLQQLFVLNSPFVDGQAVAIIANLGTGSPAERLTRLYQRLFQRNPTEAELHQGIRFVSQDTPVRWRSLTKALLGLNEFFFVD